MLKQHEKSIADKDGNSHEYRLMEMQGEIGFDLATELAEIGSEVLGKLGENDLIGPPGEENAPPDISSAAIGEAIKALAFHIQKKGGSKFAKRFLIDVFRDGKKFSTAGANSSNTWGFNVFGANYGELLQVLAWVVEVNFSSFFAGSLGEILALGQTVLESGDSKQQ